MKAPKLPLSDLRIESYRKLMPVKSLRRSLPVTAGAQAAIQRGRDCVINLLNGKDSRFLVVAGPCSIHDTGAATEYARRLKRLMDRFGKKMTFLMRVYFEKPRTSLGWKGLINDPHLNGSNDIAEGLKTARKLLIDLAGIGVAAGTELLDPIIAAYMGELVAWSAIGARTAESQTHRQLASGASSPVGIKNSTDGNVDVALNAMEAVAAPHGFLGVDDDGHVCMVGTRGNPHTHLVLRGGGGRSNYHMEDVAEAEAKLRARKLNVKIMVDCSHDNSGKDHTRQGLVVKEVVAQKKVGNRSIFGIMLESNLHPGNQPLPPPKELSKLKPGVSITDRCIGWEETEELLEFLHQNLDP